MAHGPIGSQVCRRANQLCGELAIFSFTGVLKGILNQFNQWLVFPLGRNLRPCQTSGILETTTPVGPKLVVVHLEGKEARKLEGFAEFRGSLDVGDRILEDFTLAGWTVRYNVNF